MSAMDVDIASVTRQDVGTDIWYLVGHSQIRITRVEELHGLQTVCRKKC
jgi:hypothetical protein